MKQTKSKKIIKPLKKPKSQTHQAQNSEVYRTNTNQETTVNNNNQIIRKQDLQQP